MLRLLLRLVLMTVPLMITTSITAQDSGRVISITASVTARVAISPDAHTAVVYETGIAQESIVTDPADVAMQVIDLDGGSMIATLTGHTDYISGAIFTADGSQLITSHTNGEIFVWDMSTYQPVRSGRLPFLNSQAVAILDTDALIVRTVGYPTSFLLVDLQSLTLMGGWSYPFEFYGAFMELMGQGVIGSGYVSFITAAISPDNTLLALANQHGLLAYIDTTSGEWVNLFTIDLTDPPSLPANFYVRSLEFTPTGEVVYYHAGDDQTYALNLQTNQIKPLIVGGHVFAISPDGGSIAYVRQSETTVYLASLAGDDPVVIGELPIAARLPTELTFSPDGAQLIAAGMPDPGGQSAIVIFDLP